ncbi:hypothetical protein ASD90_21640 [Terrabacter sp. Root181]|nr:hypothetical protein ASD90_21640 [Terrabacter sp. Root181]
MGLLTIFGEGGEDVSRPKRTAGSRASVSHRGLWWAERTARSVLMSFLIDSPVASWRYRLTAKAANTMVRCASMQSCR